MNKEFVEIINRLRAILQDSWINELPDNEKIAINFNKSELKLILNCISKEDIFLETYEPVLERE